MRSQRVRLYPNSAQTKLTLHREAILWEATVLDPVGIDQSVLRGGLILHPNHHLSKVPVEKRIKMCGFMGARDDGISEIISC